LKALDGSTVVLSGEQVSAPGSLLALRVNGADLSLDHGFPARVIVPAMPGSYNLKWMSHIIFGEGA
jgi:DMSO/TMAO reductase YedYZ molybdopterin-dependent catalytic subunit